MGERAIACNRLSSAHQTTAAAALWPPGRTERGGACAIPVLLTRYALLCCCRCRLLVLLRPKKELRGGSLGAGLVLTYASPPLLKRE